VPESVGYDLVCVPPLMARDHFSSHGLYLENIRSAFARRAPGLRIEVVGLSTTSPNETRLHRRYLQFYVLPRLLRQCLARPRERPVVVNILDQHYAYLKAGGGVPFVLTCHGVFNKVGSRLTRSPLYRYQTRLLPEIDRIVAVSNDAKDDLVKTFGVDSRRVSVSHYGVEPVFGAGEHVPLFPERGNSTMLLHVGTNLRRKNVGIVLRSMKMAVDRGVDVKLVKVGEALEGDERTLVSALGLNSRIVYLGKLSPNELAQVYRSCDIFVFPSTYEGFGRPILEAQACGIPCILADASCLPEVGGEGALYHGVNDAAALASHVIALTRDATLRHDLIRRGIENTRRFSWDKHVDGLLKVYSSLADPGAVGKWASRHRS